MPTSVVHDREVLLVAVYYRVQDLPEVVVRRDGLGTALCTHDVRNREATHRLALADHLGFAAGPEEDKDGYEDQEGVDQQPYEKEDKGEELADPGRHVGRPNRPETGREQATQHPSTVHRKGWYQVKDGEHDVQDGEGRERLPGRAYPHDTSHGREVGAEQEGQSEKERSEHHVDQRTSDGDLYLVDGLFGKGLHTSQSTYREEGYIPYLDPEPLGD